MKLTTYEVELLDSMVDAAADECDGLADDNPFRTVRLRHIIEARQLMARLRDAAA